MIYVFAEEARSGHCSHSDFTDQVEAEFRVVFVSEFRYVDKNIVCSLRFSESESQITETVSEQIFHVSVFVLQPFIVAIVKSQAGHGRFHERRSSAYCQKIVDLFHTIDHIGRRHDVAETPARYGICLGKRIADDRSLAHPR